MIGFQKDDGGRRDAGFKGDTGDCVTRAIAILTGEPYKDVYRYCSELHGKRYGKKTARNGMHKADTTKACEHFGLRKIKLGRGPKLTFSEAYEDYGNCIVTTTGHVAAIVDGNLRDNNDIRQYTMQFDDGSREVRERKAMSIWVNG